MERELYEFVILVFYYLSYKGLPGRGGGWWRGWGSSSQGRHLETNLIQNKTQQTNNIKQTKKKQ